MADSFALGADPEGLLVVKKTGAIRTPADIVYDPDPHDSAGKATAIGKDGNRETSSFEFRPGRSSSSLALVNRIGELATRLYKHYHPPGVAYKAGAYWHAPNGDEPLGGHIHLSWVGTGGIFGPDYANKLWQVCEILKGFRAEAEFLHPKLFNENDLALREKYARTNGKDFAIGLAIRPHQLEEVMATSHLEYRYPASWLDSPEAAYCFLGGAEYIVREVFGGKVGQERDWAEFIKKMFTDESFAPPKAPPLAHALTVAMNNVGPESFMDNWVS